MTARLIRNYQVERALEPLRASHSSAWGVAVIVSHSLAAKDDPAAEGIACDAKMEYGYGGEMNRAGFPFAPALLFSGSVDREPTIDARLADALHFCGPESTASQWPARLTITVGATGRGSRIVSQRHHGPLYVQRAFYPEGPDHPT